MRKLIAGVVTAILVLSLRLPVYAAPTSGYRPVHATDVEVVKKVTFHGAAQGGKTAPLASTGILGTTVKGKRYGVVIGINDYPGTSSDLHYCVADADEMTKVLLNTYGFDQVIELTDTAASKTAIYGAINAIKSKAKSNGEVFFFFSGHGAKGRADDGDSDVQDQAIVVQENSQFSFIWDGELVQWFSDFAPSRIIFAFDSCLSGGMGVLNAPGRVVCMGSTINGMSLEGAQWGGGHGQFTYYFAEEGMDMGLASVYDNILGFPNVTAEGAFDYANANCRSQAPTIADGFPNDLLP